jgi:uncharacterized pyridoxal phosphate-containing UPF0001 family protein
MNLKNNYDQIQNTLRNYPSVKLVAVSKYATTEQIKEGEPS